MAAHRIYIVDNDRFLLDLYAMKFKNAGYAVEAFGSGDALLAALRSAKAPEAVLLDVFMPGKDGFETLASIRKEKLAGATKFIVLSNRGQDADLEKARALGAAGYIIKASAIPSEVLAETARIIAGAAAPAAQPA